MLAKLTYKNQITIPKEVISFFGHVDYFDVERKQDAIVLKPVEIKTKGAALSLVRKKIKELGLKEGMIEEAIRWARSGRQSS